jgi:hypothetical protein
MGPAAQEGLHRFTHKESFMSIFASPQFLSRVMWLDAASCAATGALQLLPGDALARWTGLPNALLVGTGWFLLAYAAAAAWMASRASAPRRAIGLVVLGNLLWAVGCGALLLSAALNLSALGVAWVLVQAVVVVVLADLQWMGLRASSLSRGGRQLAAG